MAKEETFAPNCLHFFSTTTHLRSEARHRRDSRSGSADNHEAAEGVVARTVGDFHVVGSGLVPGIA